MARFTTTQQKQIEMSLANSTVSYDQITFHSNGKVTLRQAITDQKTINYAKAGIFTSLKPMAWKVSSALGGQVDYMVVRYDGDYVARFSVCVDKKRVERNARPIEEKPAGNWAIDRRVVLTTAKKLVDAGATIEKATQTAIEVHYIGWSKRHAALRFAQDLESMVDEPLVDFEPGQQIWMVVQYNGKTVRIKGEVTEVAKDSIIAISNRTSLVYNVPAELVFEHRPPAAIVNQAYA